jgi:predicted Zn-dependent peptidase
VARFDALLVDWRGNGPPPAGSPEVARPEQARIWLLDRPGAPQAVLRAGHVGIARDDPDYSEVLLANQILGGQFSSRLNERLREQSGLTYGIRSHVEARREPGPIWIGASLQADRLGEAISQIRAELQEFLAERPATDRELADARRALVEGQARHFEGPSALVGRFGSLFLQGLPTDEHRRLPDRLGAVSLDSLRAAAGRVFRPDALTFVVVADAERVLPQLESLSWAGIERIDDGSGTSESGR